MNAAAPAPAHSNPAESTPLPLSALNDFLYCQRRAALKLIDGLRGDNEHTVLGNLAHAQVDTPGYEQRAGWELLRALPLFSDSLGLTGKADLVEVLRDPATGHITAGRPVEYKKGPQRRWNNDDVQLCAQAFCLEEMFGLAIPEGAVFHAASQHCRQVTFDDTLRSQTRAAIADLRALITAGNIPDAVLKPQCDGCSLRVVCLPEQAAVPQASLFTPRDYPA